MLLLSLICYINQNYRGLSKCLIMHVILISQVYSNYDKLYVIRKHFSHKESSVEETALVQSTGNLILIKLAYKF